LCYQIEFLNIDFMNCSLFSFLAARWSSTDMEAAFFLAASRSLFLAWLASFLLSCSAHFASYFVSCPVSSTDFCPG
jgi:hypothetical protein